MKRHDGYSIVELLVVLGILALIAGFVLPNIGDSVKKYEFRNSYRTLIEQISTVKSEAITRNTTSRLSLQQVAGVYTLTAYVTPTPVANCNGSNPWTQISTMTLDVPREFQITGSGVGDICFYRDSSSTGGQYVYDDGAANIGSATITIAIATGYLDVDATY